MARSLSTRFGLQRWSSDADSQSRADFDTDAAQLDLLAAMYGQGTLAGKGAASAANAGKFWMITDATGGGVVGQFYYSDGTTWRGPFIDKTTTDAAYAAITAEAAWTAYTPTLTGVTLGNGTIQGWYRKTGKTLHLRVYYLHGSTSSITGGVSVSLPGGITAAAAGEQGVPVKLYTGGGTTNYLCFGVLPAAGTVFTLYGPTSSSVTTLVAIDATHPAALSTGGNIVVQGTIEVA